MVDHACINIKTISELRSDVDHMKENNEKFEERDSKWKNSIEVKIDKILWFFLGQSVGLIITVIAGVIMYVITKS